MGLTHFEYGHALRPSPDRCLSLSGPPIRGSPVRGSRVSPLLGPACRGAVGAGVDDESIFILDVRG